MALDLDETQYRDGFGPCLEVAQSAGTVTVPDMTAETRWPAFARQALVVGVHSSLSVALPLQEAVVGALNIYASQPAVFDQDTIEMARTFAGYAAVAIANVRLYQSTATLAEDMRRAMETRAVIEQAKGILIAQQHCTPSRPSNCSPGFPRPPIASSATVPPTSSPAQPKTAPLSEAGYHSRCGAPRGRCLFERGGRPLRRPS